ncbi:high affinity immunoglobulin gamma Fc receptor I-like [Pelobates fuscus]|uniref:high affinity immunoglobulin gamma Fc receptor I-like n=1 Tax=Pelobates fuscus TaxID=191477 RepID=UPI002FE4AA98
MDPVWCRELPAAIIGNSETAVRPVVSFTPNWRKIFVYESVTITCSVHPSAQWVHQFYWYKDNKRLHMNNQSVTIDFADETHTGNYQCKTNTTQQSDPAKLSVLNGWVILQVPLLIYKGDILSLKCHSFPGRKAQNAMFFLHDKLLNSSGDILQVGKVNLSKNGPYKCKKEVYSSNTYRIYIDDVSVSVTELFSSPELKVIPYPQTVGHTLTLICDTSLPPLKEDTELHFAFYRNGQKVQEFGTSNKHQINSAHFTNSGYYTCEVKTVNDDIKKISNGLYLKIASQVELDGPQNSSQLPRMA